VAERPPFGGARLVQHKKEKKSCSLLRASEVRLKGNNIGGHMEAILSQAFNIMTSQSEGSITMNGVTLEWDREVPHSSVTVMEFGQQKTFQCFDLFEGLEAFIEEATR
jgi:hypothetical protein